MSNFNKYLSLILAILTVTITLLYFINKIQSDNDRSAWFVDYVFINISGIFGCIMFSVFLDHINILDLFLVILGDVIFCMLLFYFSYDAVYKDYKDQIKQNNMNKSIKF